MYREKPICEDNDDDDVDKLFWNVWLTKVP